MENENASNKKSIIPIAVLVLLVLVAGGYFFFGHSNVDNKGNLATNSNNVATVNGVAITKTVYDAQLNNAIAMYKAQGVDVTNADKLSQIKTQVLNNLINNELLSQNIAAAGIKAAPEDVEKQFQLILTQAGGADAFKAELAKSNLSEAQLRDNISKQLAVQAYLLQNIDTKSITVSDVEIAQFYADYSKAQKDSGQKTVPALKDLSDQIKQQLISNKQQALVATFVASLQTKAKIEITASI